MRKCWPRAAQHLGLKAKFSRGTVERLALTPLPALALMRTDDGSQRVLIFESLFNALRAYVFSHTTSRIDVELGARLFRHLMALPLACFQARRVG